MRSIVRLLLVWSVVLALPLQGLAASTMLFCVPQPHTGQAAESHGHAAHDHTGVDHAALHADRHAGQDHSGPTGDDSTCSVCAACCTGVAITVSVLQPTVLETSPHYAPAHSDPHTGFMTAGIERPPRHSLA